MESGRHESHSRKGPYTAGAMAWVEAALLLLRLLRSGATAWVEAAVLLLLRLLRSSS